MIGSVGLDRPGGTKDTSRSVCGGHGRRRSAVRRMRQEQGQIRDVEGRAVVAEGEARRKQEAARDAIRVDAPEIAELGNHFPGRINDDVADCIASYGLSDDFVG